MSAIYVSKISQWIEKRFNAKGGNVVTDVDPSAIVVIPLPVGNEDRYLQGWDRFALRFFVGAVAAQFGEVQLRNPKASNIQIVVEKVTFEWAVAGEYLTFEVTTTTDLATVVGMTFQRWDNRGRNAPTAIASQTTAAALPANTAYHGVFQAANTSYDLIQTVNQEIPINPGDGFASVFSIANSNVVVSYWWREKGLEASELT